MTIELPPQIETAVKQQATARGISPVICVLEVLARNFTPGVGSVSKPLKNGYGLLAKYGPAPSAQDIYENRADMLRDSIFAKDVE